MSVPGFTAEASLQEIQSEFRQMLSYFDSLRTGAVIPQLPVSSGCGDCSPLKWPDGTKTGACARACCDALRCWTETCACGGSTGVFRGGGGSTVFREM